MKNLICLGDSISDCERLFSPNGLGYGYVNELDTLLNQENPQYHIVNRGVDGFVVRRLLENVGRDCIDRNPDVTTILIGINDVGLMMNTCRSPSQQQTMLREFGVTYRLLLQKITEFTHSKLILLEPFIFPCPREYANWIPFVEDISGQIGDLASEYHCPYILLHDRLNEAAKKDGYNAITTDGIHLTSGGHKIITHALEDYL